MAALWIIAFAASMCVPAFMAFVGLINSPLEPAEAISALYAPYTGAVVAFYLIDRAPRLKTKRPEPLVNPLALPIAVTASILWNAILWGMVFVTLKSGHGETSLVDALKDASQLATQASWLLAPVMGYYFAVSKA